jgi:hypothetical protein
MDYIVIGSIIIITYLFIGYCKESMRSGMSNEKFKISRLILWTKYH